jgi:hypothetical protein
MLIRILRNLAPDVMDRVAGGAAPFQEGELIDADQSAADDLIRSGLAEPLSDEQLAAATAPGQ